MDIYKAEKAINSLLMFVKKLEEDNPRMYGKSKARLHDIALRCLDTVKTISNILQDEVLETDQDEFENKTESAVIAEVCSDIQQTGKQLAELVGVSPIRAKPSEDSDKLSPSKRRSIINRYSRVLSKLAESDIPYSCVRDCASLLWFWFQERFLKHGSGNFHYNIRRIPEWVCDIIVMYSKHLEEGNPSAIIEEFHAWGDGLSFGKSSTYAIPYSVYVFDKDKSPECATLCAAVIFDILFDYGLKDLCTMSTQDLFLSEDTVYNLCSNLNPESLNDYNNYKHRPEVLALCGIARKEVG